MSRTTNNRRKKVNRRWRCHWCGITGYDSPEGLCYSSYLLPDDDGRMFCSDKCCGAFNDKNETLRKSIVHYVSGGGVCKVYKGGELQYSFPMEQRPMVMWTPIQ